jgi:hypothetical protein
MTELFRGCSDDRPAVSDDWDREFIQWLDVLRAYMTEQLKGGEANAEC